MAARSQTGRRGGSWHERQSRTNHVFCKTASRAITHQSTHESNHGNHVFYKTAGRAITNAITPITPRQSRFPQPLKGLGNGCPPTHNLCGGEPSAAAPRSAGAEPLKGGAPAHQDPTGQPRPGEHPGATSARTSFSTWRAECDDPGPPIERLSALLLRHDGWAERRFVSGFIDLVDLGQWSNLHVAKDDQRRRRG